MDRKINNSNGITLIALVITIIVLTIIVSITIYSGIGMMDNSKVQSFITDMLSIKSKVKGYSEEIDSQTWDKSGDDKETTKQSLFANNKLELYTESVEEYASKVFWGNTEYRDTSKYSYVYYTVTEEALKNMKLEDIVNETTKNYIVVFAKDSEGDYESVDVIRKEGIEYEDSTYYTLSELQSIFEEE